MQFTTEEAVKKRVPRNSAISIPTSIYPDRVFDKGVEIDQYYDRDSKSVLTGLLSKQHPLIHTWLVLSSVSICFLSALFFIFP